MSLIQGSSLYNINSLIETSKGRPLNQKEGNKLMKNYSTWKENTLKKLNELGTNDKYDYLYMNFNLGFSLNTYPNCIPGKELDHLKSFDLQLFQIKKGSTNDFELDQLIPFQLQPSDMRHFKNPIIGYNVFENLKKEKFLVSIPLENEIARLMTPLLFYELRIGLGRKNLQIVRLRSWWKCHDNSAENNNFFIMKDKYDISLKNFLRQRLDFRAQPDFLFVWKSLYSIFTQFRTLHKSHNGFLHGNLNLENIVLTGVEKHISMINLENSSFYINGYRFYTPAINNYLHRTFFSFIDLLFKIEIDAGNKFYKLIQDIPSTGRVGEFAKSITQSVIFNEIGVNFLQDFISTFIDIPSIGYLDYINMLLVQNNPLFSLPGSYDIYSLICSLFSEDYMYIHVMKPNFKKNGEPKGVACNDDLKLRYNIDKENDSFCPYRDKLVRLWKAIWFPDELKGVTRKILEIGKEREPLRNIVETNRFLLPFKLKVDLSDVFELFGLRNVIAARTHRKLSIVTTEDGHICADDSDGEGFCDTSFGHEVKIEQIAEDTAAKAARAAKKEKAARAAAKKEKAAAAAAQGPKGWLW